MTKNFLSKKLKSLLVLLITLCVFCTCAFAVACNDDENTDSDSAKTYSYVETDTETLSNANFAYATHGKTAEDFPISSLTGWTRAVDNSAKTSDVDSGVISVASDSWNKVFDKLYGDSDFVAVYKELYPDDLADDKTDDEKKEFLKNEFANPAKHSDDADDFIYMLNNYTTSTLGKGTAQRIRSSSSVSVKKGEIYKISVYAYANVISGDGANVRFTNTVSGNTQAEFQVNDIKAKEWKEYTVYFVANGDYDCTFTLSLGLGYGNGSVNALDDYVMGTVFFDDIKVEKFEGNLADIDFDDDAEQSLAFGAEDPKTVSAASTNVFKYDMNFDTDGYFYRILNANQTVNVDRTATVEIKDENNGYFTIGTDDESNYEKYVIVAFKLQNNLNKLGSTDVTVNVVDIYDEDPADQDPPIIETRKAVATFSTVAKDENDFENCYIVVRNNFKNQERNFYLELVIGPTDLTAVSAASEYASGSVTISEVGYTAANYISSEKYQNKNKNINYKLYSFFNSNANATTALYAGYNADYTVHNHANFTLTPTKANIGEITEHPTAVSGYSGLVSDHILIKGETPNTSLETKINDRTQFTENGYAGLINTKYLAAYSNSGLSAVLDGLHDEDDIQPIVIYNNYADGKDNHYGYIGTQQTVSASSYAKVSVQIKVFGENAKAFIYLVDTSKSEKDVMHFVDFTVNTAEGLDNAAVNGKTLSGADYKFVIEVNEDSPVGEDGWVQVNFYLATGADAKNFRVEVWNGGRDGGTETESVGYVVVNSIEINTASAFTEPTSIYNAFTDSSNPLYKDFDTDGKGFIAYTRELTDTEKEFNKEYPDQAVSYKPSYVWAKNDTTIYAVFNTVNPTEHNPYDDLPEEEEESGCAAESDPSTFWLSFSSILLAVVLVAAIVALIIKRYHAKRKDRKSDAKSQYKVKSRTESQKEIRKAKERALKADATAEADETTDSETADETAEPVEQSAETPEQTENGNAETDETEQTGYVYGEVQDFGDMTFDIPEENKAENAEDKKDE